MPTCIDKFLDLVLRSSLATPSQLVDTCQGFDITREEPEALDDLCRHLQEKGLLTEWQCEKLLHGKWKGFFLDGYCLLNKTGEDAEKVTSTYLCRDVNSGREVAMIVTSPAATGPGPIQYVVRELSNDETS